MLAMTARLPFYVLALLSVLVAIGSWRFLGLGLDLSFPGFEDHLETRRSVFALHVAFAPVALALGVLQFMPGLRARRPALHRWTGRLYALCVLVSGVAGFWLGLFAPGGWIAGMGFLVLAVLWIGVTANAVSHARHRRFADHRVWMIRSFALTFAGVTLRIYLAGYMLSDVSYVVASPVLGWVCWVPNLLIAEWWLARERARLAAT
jgi:uncharacterized membrane protein